MEGAASLAQEAAALPEPLLEGLPAQDVLMLALLLKAEPWLTRWQKAASLKAKGNDAYRSSSRLERSILLFTFFLIIYLFGDSHLALATANTERDVPG